jgi:hypothetical protein
MGQIWRLARWAAFIVLSLLSYAVLAGVCQSLTFVALRFLNHEFDQRVPQFFILMAALLAPSVGLFLLTGRLLAWTLPVGGRAVFATLVTLSGISALVPLDHLPYSLLLNCGIRCSLATLACWLMVTGARMRVRRRSDCPPLPASAAVPPTVQPIFSAT